MTVPTRKKLDGLAGGGLALAAFGLYALTLAPTALTADSGEFQFTAWLPGITHPTGYPLYTLLGWLWTHLLPWGEVAWRMNALSAILAAAAVGLTYAVARQLLNLSLPDTPLPGRMLAAGLSAAAFAVTPTFWSQAIVAEVYALHVLFIVALLGLTLQWQRVGLRGRSGWAQLLAFTAGLSLTHHRTTLLLWPALAVYLLWNWCSNVAERRDVAFIVETLQCNVSTTLRTVFILALFFAAPLLLYLYLPLIAPFTPYATLALSPTQTLVLYDNSLRGFWDHITGAVFTAELQPTAVNFDRLRLVGQLLRQEVGWTGIILALAGCLTLWQRRRFEVLALTGLASLSFTLFNLIYFIGDVYVLFIPVWLMVCLWLGLGSLGLAHWLAGAFVRRKTGPADTRIIFGALEQRLGSRVYRLLVVGVVGVILVWVLFRAAPNFAAVGQSHNTAARDRWQTILSESIPPGAVLVSNDRNDIMPMWYYQYVEGRRPDLLGLFPLIVTDPAYANVGRVLNQALASGRPVYLIKPLDGLNLKADLTPEGTLYRATAARLRPATPREAVLQGQTDGIKLWGYDLSPTQVAPGGEVTLTLYWQANGNLSADYSSYVHLLNRDNQGVAQSDHLPGGDFYPSHYWEPGEVLRDSHILPIPAAALPGAYRLRAGLYTQVEGKLTNLGNSVDLGQVVVLNSK